MSDLQLESFLSPIADGAPCGADLEYDPAFLALQEAATRRAEQQYGETVVPSQEPDWSLVHAQTQQLALRSRDLRLAVWLVRSGARTKGWAGAVEGLRLVHGLLQRYWGDVHPQLDIGDNHDPTARLNALMPLAHAEGLDDLRAAALCGAPGSPSVRHVELALGRADPYPGEAVPAEQGVIDALLDAATQSTGVAAGLQAGEQAAHGIVKILDQHAPARGPDFTPLLRLAKHVAEAGRRLQDALTPRAIQASGVAAPAARASAAIGSRDDAIRTLQCVCDWVERNEPGHPAPLLIQRAQRLMGKGFIDIMRDVAPDGVSQIEKLAGINTQ